MSRHLSGHRPSLDAPHGERSGLSECVAGLSLVLHQLAQGRLTFCWNNLTACVGDYRRRSPTIQHATSVRELPPRRAKLGMRECGTQSSRQTYASAQVLTR
jgi:hypothetical protein